jgi:hypothetical protein
MRTVRPFRGISMLQISAVTALMLSAAVFSAVAATDLRRTSALPTALRFSGPDSSWRAPLRLRGGHVPDCREGPGTSIHIPKNVADEHCICDKGQIQDAEAEMEQMDP